MYQAPTLTGRGFAEGRRRGGRADAVIVNRNFADTIAPGGNALGRRFRGNVRAMDGEWLARPGSGPLVRSGRRRR